MIDFRSSLTTRLGFVALALTGMLAMLILILMVSRQTEQQIAVRLAQAEMSNITSKLNGLSPDQQVIEISTIVSARHLASQIARGAFQAGDTSSSLDSASICTTPQRDRRIITAAFAQGNLPGEPDTKMAGTSLNWDVVRHYQSGTGKILVPVGAACNKMAVPAQVAIAKVGTTTLLVGWMTEPFQETARRLWLEAALGFGLMLVIGTLAALLMERRSDAQMRDLTRTLARIGHGNFDSQTTDISDRQIQGGEYHQLSVAISGMSQQLKSLHQGLNSLIDRTAHDLRTPLSRAIARINNVMTNQTDPATKTGLIAIEADLRDLSSRFSAMLALRAAANVDPNLGEPVDLAEIATLAVDLYQDLDIGENKQITLKVTPAWVYAQRGLIQNAVANLLDNALRFTPKHGNIQIETYVDNALATLIISDSGAGLSPQLALSVFEPGVTSRAEHGGYGLGLATVREVARKYHGDITLEPRKDQCGLTARLTFREMKQNLEH